jgi:hypothetical protein
VKRRIKHNDLVPWFIQDHGTLPSSYLASCRKFFKELSDKQQATSERSEQIEKQQAATFCRRTKWIIDLSVKHQAACVKVYSVKKIIKVYNR